VTPEAVIYRYLQAANADPADLSAFVRVVGADADLLGRWLTLLECPASPTALHKQLGRLPAATLRHLAQALAWSVLPISGSARLSLDQWQAVLRAGCLAQVLAERIEDADLDQAGLEAVRWRVLLAISGVNLPHDPVMAELNLFRGAAPELLEDADVVLRVFAVVDAVEVLTDDEAAALADTLLGVDPEGFAEAFALADQRSRELLHELRLTEDVEADWSDRLWLQQQVIMLGSFLSLARSADELLTANGFAARCLFHAEPYLLRLQDDGRLLKPLQGGGSGIHLDSSTSEIAAAVRDGIPRQLVDEGDRAVADRQVLRRLGAMDALCIVLEHGGQKLGAIVFPLDEDVDTGFAMHLYAEELSRHLGEARRDGGSSEQALKRYRSREEKRLRELVHEANNPLSIVQNYLHILELRLQHEPTATEQIGMIGTELKRAAEIFQRARELPPLDEQDTATGAVFEEFDLNDLARRAVEMHRGYAEDHHVELQSMLAGGELGVRSDEQRLAQVLNNLLRNAIEAGGEQVTLGTATGVYREGREGIEVFVKDSGPGLPRSVLETLAEPKHSDKGGDHAGLGLHLVHRLCAELKAGIDVRTASGEGTRFTLFLPLAPV